MKAILPISHISSNDYECVDGNGFMVSVDGKLFFLTCHHVLTNRHGERHYITIDNQKVALDEHGVLYRGIYNSVIENGRCYVQDFGCQEWPSTGQDYLEFIDPLSVPVDTHLSLVTHDIDGKQIHIPCKRRNNDQWIAAEVNGEMIDVYNAFGIEEMPHSTVKIARGHSGGAVVVAGTTKCVGMLKGSLKCLVSRGNWKDIPYFINSDVLASFIRESPSGN
jgi:hypothetical protein